MPAPLGREPQPTEALAEDVEPIIIRVEGSVHDQFGEAVLTEVQISGETNGQRTVEVFNTNSLGNFLGTLPLADTYTAVINTPGYLVHQQIIQDPRSLARVKLDIELQKLEKKASLSLPDILFENGSFELGSGATAELDLLVMSLLTNQGLKVKLSGHAWESGSAAENKDLSERRARAVADYLISKGIAKKRVSWKAYGKTRTLDPQTEPSALGKSRRVEIMLQL